MMVHYMYVHMCVCTYIYMYVCMVRTFGHSETFSERTAAKSASSITCMLRALLADAPMIAWRFLDHDVLHTRTREHAHHTWAPNTRGKVQ